MPSLPSSIEALIFGKKRQIAGIIPDVVIEEKHHDELVITDHPVEKGAIISDHAYKQPEEVTVKFGWSDSSNALNSLISGSIFSGLNSLQDIYAKLLKLQNDKQPFDLGTGKREYVDMLIKSLSVTTDVTSEAALMCTAVFRHVNYVFTATSTLDASAQASPEQTGPVAKGGERQLTTPTNPPAGF